MSSNWTTAQMPDQHGRTALVTGANSGLGLISARELARKGASVVLACRNTEKGEARSRRFAPSRPTLSWSLPSLISPASPRSRTSRSVSARPMTASI